MVHRHYDKRHFDVKANERKKARTGNKDDGNAPYGRDARAVFHHDPASGHGLLVQFQTNTVWAYDPAAAAWSKLAPEGDPMPTGGRRLASVDPARDAAIVIDGVAVWAYRYKAA